MDDRKIMLTVPSMNFLQYKFCLIRYDTMIRYAVYRVDYSSCVVYRLSDRQDEGMDELNLFIDYHTKYTVSII